MSGPAESEELPIVIVPDDYAPDDQRSRSGGVASGREPIRESDTIERTTTRVKAPPEISSKRYLSLIPSGAAVLAVAALLATVVIVLRNGILSVFYPLPGELSAPHAQMAGMPGTTDCVSCHAEGGVAQGCLSCHEEIAAQLSRGQGYHHFLLRDKELTCTPCHSEHHGNDFQLISSASWEGQSRESFRHPHLSRFLEGKHRALVCEKCHREKLREKFNLPRFPALLRQHTFLGLSQECAFCHEDIHSGGFSENCDACHTQHQFAPATFDHPQHFPLEGGHVHVRCDRCHLIPDTAPPSLPENFPFHKVRGTLCGECHESPHRTNFNVACESCHTGAAPAWIDGRQGMTAALHALTSFRLLEPHLNVDCEKCHDPTVVYEERYPDPSAPGYRRTEDTCQGCHGDAHDGQFLGKGMRCLDCHERHQFKPHRFDRGRHATVYPLEHSHEDVDCESCHQEDPSRQVRIFVGTSTECRACHEDPHAGQFRDQEKRCEDCHDTRRFLPALFGHDPHEIVFPLVNAHLAVPCTACHTADQNTGTRVFVGTPRSCKGCHENPHGSQFTQELLDGDCTACHRDAIDTFALRPFDHEARTGYALTGAHGKAECDQCHVEAAVSGIAGYTKPVRIYRGTSTECSTCHRDIHRAQFSSDRGTACGGCHVSTAQWAELKFDHNTQSRFALDGSHLTIPCERCHLPVELPDGSKMTQYKPLGTECEDCHEVVPR